MTGGLAVVVLDWRTLPGVSEAEHVRQAEAAISHRLPQPPEGLHLNVRFARERQGTYTGLSEERTLYTPGFLMDAEHPVVRAAARAVSGPGAAAVRSWTFATDGGHTCGTHGIPTIGFAPGEERFAHTSRERLELRAAEDAFGRYPDLILAVQESLA